MTPHPHIVFLSLDGLLEPLGYSQVVRLARGISRNTPYRMTLISLEKNKDLLDGKREAALAAELHEHHIGWHSAPWSDGGTPLDVARNLRALSRLLRSVTQNQTVDLIHARSYVPASVARHVGGPQHIPYLFDIRGYWVDERLEQGRWFTGPLRIKAARRWERDLYANAAGVVCLTELAAADLITQPLSPWNTHKPVRVIPTCVDYGEFGLGGPGDAGGVSEGLADLLQSSLVVGFVGAVEQAYCVKESIRLFDHVLARRPDAHLLCLTRNPPALLSLLQEQNIPSSHFSIHTVAHDEIAHWLPLMDWGLLLRRTEPSHRAAMPTKLAEFFASGVRPIQWGCNDEVRSWVQRAGSGLILDNLDETSLRNAADSICSKEPNVQELLGARWRTKAHFDLLSGVQRYGQIYDQILHKKDTSIPITTRPHSTPLTALFLTEGTTVPASRFRVEQLVPHLEKRGVRCTVRPAYGDAYHKWAQGPVGPAYKLLCSLQRLPFLADADRFDLLFLQRPALPFSSALERLASWRNPNTIFDVDDAIFVGADGSEQPRRRRAFEAIAAASAHVICGNDYLAQAVGNHSPTTVIPTVVDTSRYRPANHRPKKPGEPLRIGWMGTSSNFVSLQLVTPLLRRLVEDYDDLIVQIVSDQPFPPLQHIPRVEQIRWSSDREIPLLQGFDIGIMPLIDNAATRGKCGFKAIQYMAVGLPVVASAVGANPQILGGEDVGFLPRDLPAFEAALLRLIADDALRQQMGKAGRARVNAHFCIDAVIDDYLRLFHAVARQPHTESPNDDPGRALLSP